MVNRHGEAGFGIGTREQTSIARHEGKLTRVFFLRLVARPDSGRDNPLLELLSLDMNAPLKPPGQQARDGRLPSAGGNRLSARPQTADSQLQPSAAAWLQMHAHFHTAGVQAAFVAFATRGTNVEGERAGAFRAGTDSNFGRECV